jgi:uncharacterized protein (DUF2141 family)
MIFNKTYLNKMKQHILIFLLFVLILSCAGNSDPTRSISGNINYDGKQQETVIIRLYRLQESSSGNVNRLSKRDIYGAVAPFRILTLNKPARYVFNDLPVGHYSIISFVDVNSDGELGFDPPEPLGWYSSQFGGKLYPIALTKTDVKNADCKLRCPTPFPTEEKHTNHGALRWMKGLPVLQLWGTAEERGFAHGYLVGKQIIDFFEFYIIEDSWGSPQRYQEIFVPFLETHLNCPPEFLQECDAVIRGIIASGIDMRIESLGRDFNRSDLLAINAYIERRAAFPVSVSSSCTQFAFWGDQTEGSELKGGLIAARNMDGECDVRKVTVSHLLLFAVDPSKPERNRWFSAMWPGFVGTITGINENGLYGMENAGGTGPGKVVGGVVPCSWIQRCVLEIEGSGATAESVHKLMQDFKCEGGGITTPGSIILWAVPYYDQEAPAFIYEGDRFGGVMRTPIEVKPTDPTNIMASNHHQVYGFNADQPDRSFGKPISFSSLWRYEVGMNMLEAWSRQGKPLGVAEAKQLLQMVCHGTTEYSVIFLANERKILVAVDDHKTDMWDAPFMEWKQFDFEDLFEILTP